MSPPGIRHTHACHPSDRMTAIVPLLLAVLGLAAAGALILLGGHTSQAQPQIAHLYPASQNHTGTPASGATPRKLLAPAQHTNPCVPDPPPQYYDIYGQAKSRDRIVWLLVNEGDQAAMALALAQSAERHGGYAVTNPSLFGKPSRVAILATNGWHRQHLDPLRPYGARPRPASGYTVSASYADWASAVLKPEHRQPARPNPAPCELRPTVVAINQKPVGQLTDARTKLGAWLLFGFAAGITITGLHALRPFAMTR